MRKTTIVWLMIAASFMLVGCIIAKLSMVKYETNVSKSVKIETTTGKYFVQKRNFKRTTGNISLSNVIVTNKFSVAGENKYVIKESDANTQSRQTCEKSQFVGALYVRNMKLLL